MIYNIRGIFKRDNNYTTIKIFLKFIFKIYYYSPYSLSLYKGIRIPRINFFFQKLYLLYNNHLIEILITIFFTRVK